MFNALVMNCNMRSVVCRSGRFTTVSDLARQLKKKKKIFYLEANRNLFDTR